MLQTAEQEIQIPEHIKQLHEKTVKMLTKDQEKLVTALLTEYADIFAKDGRDIGKTTLIAHDVDTGNAKPVSQAVRRMSPEEHAAMKQTVEELHRVGVVAPSKSQWASNIRMAKKKNGAWRMCIDYRDLNKRTIINDPYPLPRIDSMLDALGKGRFFTCLDLIWGYHQVPMTQRAQERTAFITPRMSPSHWEYKYMPFGLKGAPATFQRLVDTMLRGIQYDTCMAYLDDIIVISTTIEEGISRLRDVFERIRQAKLKLKAEKCDLFKEEITYLGHVISAKGVRTDPKKVAAIKEYSIPMFVTDVRGFVGLCSYYRRFIKDFSNLTKPLNDLTKVESDRVWRKEHTTAFEELKKQLSDTPVLAYPMEGCTYILDTDASGFAIGGVLSQLQPKETEVKGNAQATRIQVAAATITTDGDGTVLQERPIAYASRMLLPRELDYCARRREFLAIYEMIQYFRHYLAGAKFILRTDHDSLKGVKNLSKMSGQFARWIDYLEGFQFDIKVRRGKENANADFLSRMYTDCFCKQRDIFQQTPSACEALEDEPVQDWELFEKINNEMRQRRIRNKWNEIIKIEDDSVLQTLSMEELRTQLRLATKIPGGNVQSAISISGREAAVAEIKAVRKRAHDATKSESPMDIKRQRVNNATILHTSVNPITSEKQLSPTQVRTDVSTENRAITEDEGRVGIFGPGWSTEELRNAQQDDQELCLIYAAKANNDTDKPTWNEMAFEPLGSKYYRNEWPRIRIRHELLYREWESADGKYSRLQLIIPKQFQEHLIRKVHCTEVGCHQGFRKTVEFLRLRFFWYGMAAQVRLFITQCITCQQTKAMNTTPRVSLRSFGAGFVNERVNLDFCGPFGKVGDDFRYILVICDSFSKFTVAEPTGYMTADAAVSAFTERWVNIFGAPYEVHTDRGASFTAATWKEFCSMLGIAATTTTAYRPQANGQVERNNRTIIDMLRAMVEEISDWVDVLSHTCATFNFTPHSAHGFSPYYMMFGRHPCSMIDARLPTVIHEGRMATSDAVQKMVEVQDWAHQKAREKLKAAVETARRYYNRGGARVKEFEYAVGDKVWMKVEQIRDRGKLTDRFYGPYFVISDFGTGTYRIAKEQGEPPKIVHHDRMRKCVERNRAQIPTFILDMIDRFSRKKFIETAAQTQENGNNGDVSDDESAERQETGNHNAANVINNRRCEECKQTKFDVYGIFRTILASGLCHICATHKTSGN